MLNKQTELAHDLGLIQEECAEVIQIINKIKRFGLHERMDELTPTNLERLTLEMKDLVSVAHICEVKHNLDLGVTLFDLNHEDMKWDKVDHYKKYSRELGLLED